MKEIKRIGEINFNKFNNKMQIIKYRDANNITVQFDSGYKTKTTYHHFINGDTKYPYDKSVHNIGYLGEGDYTFFKEGKTKTIQYEYWTSMLDRCYNPNKLKINPTYKDVTVCDEWHNFQNFAKWFDENYYEIEGERISLDKDILYKGNQMYSPDNCIFVSRRINNLFVKCDKARGNFPLGVSYNKLNNNYRACCSVYNLVTNSSYNKKLGSFITPEEAFYKGYKPFKENYIKEVADYHKNKIPQKLYEAMYNWKVEIDD